MTETLSIKTPFGYVKISAQADSIVAVDFVTQPVTLGSTKNTLLKQAQQQFKAYCKKSQSAFNLPLQIQGTAFQQRVWQALQKIPVGSVQTYGDLAKQLNSSPRAVGGACRANPLPIIVPCHRVVSRHGMGGYSGQTQGANMDIKRSLLRHEGVEISTRDQI